MKWNSVEIANFIVSLFTAIGTVGAVILSLHSKKEKGKATLFYNGLLNGNYEIMIKIQNVGNKNIFIDKYPEIFLKLANKCETIPLENITKSDFETVLIPPNYEKNIFYNANKVNGPIINIIAEMIQNHKCTAKLYSKTCSEIEIELIGNKIS
ncbi:MAG: hypothetical protein BWY78_01262 [Alphaproteobacteria bacterium ADurb.Bin438]|nr:MAG: hypothetical protein BWY78_01262 [Alphaproteobacteria bacterium ADurb.Bin438]